MPSSVNPQGNDMAGNPIVLKIRVILSNASLVVTHLSLICTHASVRFGAPIDTVGVAMTSTASNIEVMSFIHLSRTL